MTDRELGRELAICCGINDPGVAWDNLARRARELLAHEAVSVKLDYPQLDRIEAKLDWIYWWNEGMRRGKPEPPWPEPYPDV